VASAKHDQVLSISFYQVLSDSNKVGFLLCIVYRIFGWKIWFPHRDNELVYMDFSAAKGFLFDIPVSAPH
jgi:hypothetical protein